MPVLSPSRAWCKPRVSRVVLTSTKGILKIRSRSRLEPGSDYHYLQRAVKTDISVRNKKAVRRAAHQLRAQQSGSQLERRRKEAGG